MCMCDFENSVYQAKKQYLYSKIWGLGADGDRGKNSSSKVPYLESPTLICIFTMQPLWGYDDD